MFRGSGGVIVFFNTSCADCRAELPVVDAAYRTLLTAGQPAPGLPGFDIICISRAEGPASIASFWEEQHLILPYAACEDRSIYNLFAPAVIPRIYLIDPELHIKRIWTDTDMPTAEELLSAIRNL